MERRLIEVDFPLREVSEQSVREKNIRHGHISSLHTWWARRPLAASRATALAALLLDDPQRRKKYFDLIKRLAPWEAVARNGESNPDLWKARRLIRETFEGRAPKVLDCFAGGGAIPLEALRLGCETYALDYNPVAVLILKAVLEYPQQFCPPSSQDTHTLDGALELETQRTMSLLESVKWWGKWVLEEAHRELSPFYPTGSDGSIPVGYIWARTVVCQNPACGAEIPIMRQTWLSKRANQRVAIRLIPNQVQKRVEFEIVESKKIDFDPSEGTVSKAHVRCPLCGGAIADTTLRRLFGEAKVSQRIVALVLHSIGKVGKHYRIPSESDLHAYNAAEKELEQKRSELQTEWAIDPVPSEPLPRERPSPNARGLSAVTRYKINTWGDLFNPRQKLALITFAQKVRKAYQRMLVEGVPVDVARAVLTYLALTFDKLAMFTSSNCTWKVGTTQVINAFVGRHALQMTWDYFEMNPISGLSASWPNLLGVCVDSLCAVKGIYSPSTVTLGSATELPWPDNFFDAVLTDPPYYDNVPYSDLSDFFYVWLKRILGDLYPELFATPLTPKSREIVWHQRHGGNYEAGKRHFEELITQAFREIHRVLKPEGIAVIVFAHRSTEAWEAIINALLNAGMYMTSSWPLDTEMEARLNAQETASLASSIYMVCRKRVTNQIGEFSTVRREIEARVLQKLSDFWEEGIRGADFFMSAIGPAVEVFGRYARVEKLSGESVSVGELLEYVRKVVSEFALVRILNTASLGSVDGPTRFYLLWRWTYNHARVPFDEARKLAQGIGLELASHWQPGGLVEKQKEYLVVPSPLERAKDSQVSKKTEFATMVDALQHAAWLWAGNRQKELKEHLEATYGGNDAFWQVAQAISEALPEGDKERQVLQGLLYSQKRADTRAYQEGKLPFEQS